MQVYLTLLRRELGGCFGSLTGYIIIAVTVLLLGFSFIGLLMMLNAEPTDAPVTELFFSTYYFWIILLLTTPVITMRTFALEKFSGTYENLMTTPVTDRQVVLAKFGGALIFYAVAWLPLLVYIAIIQQQAADWAALEWLPLLSTYLGILLIGSCYMAMGCFTSALTRSQMLAAILSYGFGIALFLVGLWARTADPASLRAAHALSYVSITEHMDDFARGIVDLRPLVLFVSLTFLFLFLTVRVVESRRWK